MTAIDGDLAGSIAYARRCAARAIAHLGHARAELGESDANVRRIERALDELGNAEGALNEWLGFVDGETAAHRQEGTSGSERR